MKTISLKKAAVINAVSQYSNIILYIGFNIVLARLLTPEEFGIFAVVSIFTTFFSKIYDGGLGSAIIQRKDLHKQDINSLYSFIHYIAVILFLVFLLLGIPISILYKNPEYILICAILAVSILFNTFNVVPYSYLLKEKQFYKIAFLNITSYFISYVSAVFLALLGLKYYALAFQTVFLSIIKFYLSKKMSGISSAKKMDFRLIKSIIPFTLYELGSSLINYWEQNLDNILISLIMGSTPLGFYSKSYTLTKYPVTAVSGAVTPVLHPILSDYQKNKIVMHKKYTQFLLCVSTAAVFVAAICFCAAKEIILILYGIQWINCIQSFTYLSLCIFPLFMMSGNMSVYKSLGRTDLLFRVVILNTCITSFFIVIGILLGTIETVALCVCIANWFNMIVTLYVLNKIGFGISLWGFWKLFISDIFMLFFIQAVCMMASYWLFPKMQILISFMIKIVIIGTIYLFYLLFSTRYRLISSIFFSKK